MTSIFSENPEKDLWRELMQFTYEANIKRYLEKNGHEANEDTINSIAGSFLQSYEYYKAAKESNLQISPLLLYYGTTNLLYGMVCLLGGNISNINNHGMRIDIPNNLKFIADTQIKFQNPKDGAVHVVAKTLGFSYNLTEYGDWTLKEFLDSIAEISDDYIKCYDVKVNNIAMLDVFNTPEGTVEKIYFSELNKCDIAKVLYNIERFDKEYLRLVTAYDHKSKKEYYVLRHKLTGKDISELSYSGQPYLRAGHKKNGNLITIPTILNMYISLFTLASLCRYHPQYWSPFVLKDTTGEKLLLEKFMFYARRLIPNYVLNILLGSTIQYSSNIYTANDRIKLVEEN